MGVVLFTKGTPMQSQLHRHKAFTLVEILIVVVILGILAAVVVPQFVGAVSETSIGTTQSELTKLRRAVEVFQVRNENTLPTVAAGDGTWGDLIANNGEYLKEAPANPYVGGDNARVIVLGSGPDAAYQRTHGWIYDDTTGEIWAGGFDADDEPLPVN
jgi:prepilin-type N-terminal cleavage/methylation domain-containing protein